MIDSMKQDSQTAVVVLHEIYGRNAHIKGVCEQLAQKGLDVYCPDLIGKKEAFPYEAEAEAYQHFMQQVGFDQGLAKATDLLKDIRPHYQQVIVVGYSVGATIAWRCSERKGLCDGVIGFYGSRIRQYPELLPACPVLLLMPREEPAFDLNSLIDTLSQTASVQIVRLGGLHGCCDPYSAHFDEQSFQLAKKEMEGFLFLHKNILIEP
ncbi:MAG: dienelactone hydrolase family protein [Clostridia bacterium]